MRAPRPRENEQKSCDDEKADKKRNDAGIDRIEGLPGDVLHDENTHSHRRDDRTHHQRDADENTEPDRVIPELDDSGEENGRDEDHERHVVDERTAQKIEEKDDDHHEDPVDGKPREPVARLRDAQEVTEHRRAGKDDEYHHRRSKRLENSCINC